MKPSVWLSLPLLAISTHALVIPTPADNPNDVTAIAGPIVQTNTTHVSNSTKSALELEYEALELLKQQLFHLHHEVLSKERDILNIINQDFRSCSGVKCYLQTALRKAPDFLELFKTHFRHHSKNSTSSYGCSWSTNSSRALVDPTSLPPSERPFDFSSGHNENPPFDFDDLNHGDHKGHLDSNNESNRRPPFSFAGGDESQSVDDTKTAFNSNGGHDSKPEFSVDSKPFEPSSDDRKHPFDFDNDEHDRPHFRPGPGHHPDHHEGRPLHHNPYDPNKPNDTPPAFHPSEHKPHHRPHHERPPFRMPHPAPRPRHFKLILATAGLVVSLLIFTILFKALRIYCANPRVRAERAARIEECRTKREYRRAACQHRLRQCLSRFHRRPRARSTDDYEEKRTSLLASQTNIQPTNVENHIIGADINSLRRAHELVGHLMRAEEGRSFSFATTQSQGQDQHPQTHLPPPPEQINPISSSSRSIHSIRTTTTLPPYAPPPPRYSQELARDIHVVDGFRYTPTVSGATPSSSASSFILDDDVTESSVVDCSSRLSMETETEGERRGRGRSRSCGKMSLELAGDRYAGRFD